MTPLEPLLHNLVACLQPTRRVWLQAAGYALQEAGLPTTLSMVVVLLGRLGGRVQHKTLAAELGIGPNALVRTVDQGETLDLLKRTDMSGDRRAKLIALTPTGSALATRMEAVLSDLRMQLLDDLPREDIETAARVMRRFATRASTYVAAAETGQPHP